jgi:hypothetical protein
MERRDLLKNRDGKGCKEWPPQPLERQEALSISVSCRPVKAARRTKTRPDPAGCLLFGKSGAFSAGVAAKAAAGNVLVAQLED